MKAQDTMDDIQISVHGTIDETGNDDDERGKIRLSCSGTGRLDRNFRMTHLFIDPARFQDD